MRLWTRISPKPSSHNARRAQESLEWKLSGMYIKFDKRGLHVETCSGSRVNLESAEEIRSIPDVPLGNTPTSIAIWPCKTRVNARFSSCVGVPKCCDTISFHWAVRVLEFWTHPCSSDIRRPTLASLWRQKCAWMSTRLTRLSIALTECRTKWQMRSLFLFNILTN